MGKITELYPGSDGVVSVLKVKTESGEVNVRFPKCANCILRLIISLTLNEQLSVGY